MPFDTSATFESCVYAWLFAAAYAALFLSFPFVRGLLFRVLDVRRGHGVALVVMFAVLTCVFRVGGSKVPVFVSDRLANFVTLRNGAMFGDETGLVTSHANLAATAAFEAETADMIAAVSNSVSGLSGAIDSARAGAISNAASPRIYLSFSAPRDMPGVLTNHNIALTRELTRVDTNRQVLSLWIRYSWELSSGAEIAFNAYAAPDRFMRLVSSTNTFPNTETVLNEDGVACECVRYEFPYAAPAAAAGITLPPQPMFLAPYEVEFGGDTDPFEVPGEGLAVVVGAETFYGGTGWVDHWPEPFGDRLRLRIVGAVCVAAQWDGVDISGQSIVLP